MQTRTPSLNWTFRLLSVACCFLACCSAASRAEDAFRSDPDWIAAQEADGAQAVERLAQVSRKFPAEPLVWYRLGRAQYGVEDWTAALASFDKALELGHDRAEAQTRRGQCLAKLKRHPEAEKAYREALDKDPDSVTAEFGLAAALYNQAQPTAALPRFEALARRQDDWGAAAQEFLAFCLYDTKEYARAAEVWEALVTLQPEDTYRRWMLAKALFKAKRYEEALEQSRYVAEHDAGRGEAARYYVGASLEGLGRTREAEEAYAAVGKGDSEWQRAARSAASALAGKPFRLMLDVLEGYDTGVITTGDDNSVTGKQDYFTQLYALAEGRVLRTDALHLWLGGEHFGLHYPEVHDNDYFEDAASLALLFPKVGPFQELRLRYTFRYAQLDYQCYEREHALEMSAQYKEGADKVRFGLRVGDSDFFRLARGLSGTKASFFWDYRRQLPLWDHELRLRGNVDYRWSEASASKRFSQRVRLAYRAQLWRALYGKLEAVYRRDDYPSTQEVLGGVPAQHRTDHRLLGEVRFDYEVWKHFSFNWGYTYESQDSRRETKEYGRHQVDAGFTFSF
ncbi:MAG: tetratricopeptide repeat protein [Planctomycetota bacterium]|nr:tetratricopeptide repeat protein [Planctomycetota bacterium]